MLSISQPFLYLYRPDINQIKTIYRPDINQIKAGYLNYRMVSMGIKLCNDINMNNVIL